MTDSGRECATMLHHVLQQCINETPSAEDEVEFRRVQRLLQQHKESPIEFARQFPRYVPVLLDCIQRFRAVTACSPEEEAQLRHLESILRQTTKQPDQLWVMGWIDAELLFHNQREMHIVYRFQSPDVKSIVNFMLDHWSKYQGAFRGLLDCAYPLKSLGDALEHVSIYEDQGTFTDEEWHQAARTLYYNNPDRFLGDLHLTVAHRSINAQFLVTDHYLLEILQPCINEQETASQVIDVTRNMAQT